MYPSSLPSSSGRGRSYRRANRLTRHRHHVQEIHISFGPSSQSSSQASRLIDGEIRLLSIVEPIPNYTPVYNLPSTSPASGSPNFTLRLNPYSIPEFENAFQSYVSHLNTIHRASSTDTSSIAAALSEKVYLDNYRILSVLIIDAALMPHTTFGAYIPLQPARAANDVPQFAKFVSLIHFTNQTTHRSFFILRGKPYALHLFYHRHVTFEFDYHAEKFQGKNAPKVPDIFPHSMIDAKIKEFVTVGKSGKSYPKTLEFIPGPSVDRNDPL